MCCRVPAVAVTVVVVVTGCLVCFEELPPHAVKKQPTPRSRTRPAITRRLRKPKQRTRQTSTPPPRRSGEAPGWSAAAVPEYVTESAVEFDPPTAGVTVAGEKEHDAPEGNPEQANETGALKPFSGETLTVAVPGVVAVAVTEPGLTATEKSAGRLMVYVADPTALLV